MHRFHLNVLLSACFVGFFLLSLQLGLNYVKYRSLVIETTAARMQIAGAAIESATRRAEQLGLGLDGIRNLDSILEREMRREPLIDDIRIISISGKEIGTTAQTLLNTENRDLLLSRLALKESDVVTVEIDDMLYSARAIVDSTGMMMGGIILSVHRGTYQSEISRVHQQMLTGFAWVFALFSLAIVPIVLLGLKNVGRVMAVFDNADLAEEELRAEIDRTDTSAQMQEQIILGNRAYVKVNAELEDLISDIPFAGRQSRQ